jgi:DNA-binding response OmpR family regulator
MEPRALNGASGLGSRPQIRPVVLLAVDDDEARAAYTYALAANGFDVMIPNGAGAPHEHSEHPSVIVVDVSVEGGDGWLRVRTFKREARTREVPIVAVVPDAGAVTQERGRREGCAALCLTTCPPAVLASGLRAVLERDGRSRQRSSA